MNLAQANYGIVDKEPAPVLHRFGTLSGRSACGKAIVPVPAAAGAKLTVCRRCVVLSASRAEALEASRDEIMGEWS